VGVESSLRGEGKHDSGSFKAGGSNGRAGRREGVTAPGGRDKTFYVLGVLRFVTSAAISLWGVAMVILGILNGFFLWIALGVIIIAIGLPLLASNPLFESRLYPKSGNIEGGSPPAPQPPVGM
jgi:hypothetical protein